MLRKNLQDAYYVVIGVVIARKASYHNKKASTPELARDDHAFIYCRLVLLQTVFYACQKVALPVLENKRSHTIAATEKRMVPGIE